MGVLAVDGLPAVVANGWGLRLDAMDSDCDGLPDWWEISMGLNPLNPNDATPLLLKEYEEFWGSQGSLFPGIISLWSGETNANDSVGTNNGIIYGSVDYTAGVIGSAFSCEGGHVRIIDAPAFQLTNSLTIEAWVRPEGDGSVIFWRGDHRAGYDPYCLSMQSTTNIQFSIENATNGGAAVETIIPYDQWTHVAATLDGSSGDMSLYTNGVLAIQTNTTIRPLGQLIASQAPSVDIGDIDPGGFPFIGDVDEVALFSRALSADEVQTTYNVGLYGPGNGVLLARPGQGAAYLVWSPSIVATNFNVYRGIGSTNTWTFVLSTTQRELQDTNLTVGPTYYYKVQQVGTNGNTTNLPIVSVVPFDCPAPLPPQINFVNPLQIPAVNGTYQIAYQMLLTNSDAIDPQGYPLVFKVGSVISGSLMINGQPFNTLNNTINSTNVAIWSPPAITTAPGTPAFTVYVDDGTGRSSNTVNVFIRQVPETYLMAWGLNSLSFLAAGGSCLGTGTTEFHNRDEGVGGLGTDFNNLGVDSLGDLPEFWAQDYFNIYPVSSSWTLDVVTNYPPSYLYVVMGSHPPQRVVGLNSAMSVSTFGELDSGNYGHCCVSEDNRLWFWGKSISATIGMPLVTHHTGTAYPDSYSTWNSSMSSSDCNPFPLTSLSPVPVLDAYTTNPMTGVAQASGCCVLKTDGTLWSFGPAGPYPNIFGRLPGPPYDLYLGFSEAAMLPGQVEIEGNDANGVIPGREIVQICNASSLEYHAENSAYLALCKDGSLWSWGLIGDADVYGSFTLSLSGTDPDNIYYTPKRLTAVEAASSSPITQLSMNWNHIVMLRQDGTISELGYIPEWDPSREVNYQDCLIGSYGMIYGYLESEDLDPAYSCVPVSVTNVPSNVIQISAAPGYAALLTQSGEVWVWGQWLGQMLTSPQKIPGLTGIKKVCAGAQFIMSLDQSGRLWGIGINNDGVFGFNDLAYNSGPIDNGIMHSNVVRVAGIENVKDFFINEHQWRSQIYAVGTEVQGKPTGLGAFPGNQDVQLVWSNYPAASSYIIYRSLNEESGYAAIGNSTTTSYTDSSIGLQNGQVYYYEVSAVVNGVETSPSWDVAATPYPDPDPVSDLAGDWTCHGVKLQWQPPTNSTASPVAYYLVEAGGLQLAQLSSGTTEYFDDTAVSGSTYTYSVVSVNSAGQATASIAVNGSTPSIPCDPAPLVAANNSNPNWLSVATVTTVDGVAGSDKATLDWTGAAGTNATWTFQNYEFDPASISGFISTLSQADPGADPFSFWLWSNFSSATTNILSNSSNPAATNIAVLVAALNQFLTNSIPVTNDFIVKSIPGGRFTNDTLPLRSETTNLFNTSPTGSALVQLKRMLLDDYYYDFNNSGHYFTRGGNWGSLLNGFRIHYTTILYENGVKLVRNYQTDIGLNNVTYYFGNEDDEGFGCNVYQYSWSIPQGAACWASVSALVDGQEGDVSTQVGPASDNNEAVYGWNNNNGSIEAIPGCQQVYLDWSDDPNASSYDIYYTTDSSCIGAGSGFSGWIPLQTGLQVNRFWHTGLTNDTTYYYMLTANDYYYQMSVFTNATVVPVSQPAFTNFNASASAYDGMVEVEWTVPNSVGGPTNTSLNQTNWEFFVERKLSTDDPSNYVMVADSGYGLAYLDSSVVDGQTYNYRVTAFDLQFNRLQALAAAAGGSSTNITPSATNGLTLLPPVPGNGYVDLTWSPIRATQFSINRSLSSSGPFISIGSQNVNNAYQNAANTYRDAGLQNGVTYYYQIAAITPTGYEIDSTVQPAMPLATLTPLPPQGFQGILIPIDATNTVALSWNSEPGASQYQVFLQNQTSLTPLFTGSANSYNYVIPPDQQSDSSAVFYFALRSVSSQGLASGLTTTTVSNLTAGTVENLDYSVVLQIAGSASDLTVTGPTNLVLNADVIVPGVSQVNFYDGGNLIGSASQAPYQMVWYHVPGGPHLVTAQALVTSATMSYISDGSSATISSQPIDLTVKVEPQLSAYQTSATDLQLPAPALPISLTRSYTSRNGGTAGILGYGWSAGWNGGSVTLSTNMGNGWQAVYQTQWTGEEDFYISDTNGHTATVSLPGGQGAIFGTLLNYTPGSVEIDGDVGFSFQDYSANPGSLSSGTVSLSADCPNYDAGADDSDWNGVVNISGFNPNQFTYISPDGTTNVFGQPLGDGLTWLLTQSSDLNGNTLNYVYDAYTNLSVISNSCGREVTFTYTPTATGTNISVYDMLGGYPSVVYVVSNSFLTEVHQLVNRTSGSYITNIYNYGSTGADANLLVDVFNAQGVRTLHNIYTNNADGGYTGDLAVQISPGKTNAYAMDDNYDLTVTATTSTATNTVMVTSDSSGSISGATQPVSGTAASSTNATQCTYDSKGNLISQTDANGNTTTYTYDSQNRLIGQSDANGNSTSTELNPYSQPTLSTDANGQQTVYQYDNAGNTTSVNDPSGTTTSYIYSSPVNVGNLYLGAMQTSQSQQAPYVPYNIVTLNNYNTASGPVLGDLLQTTEEWQDANSNVVGKAVTTSYTYDVNGNRLTQAQTRTVNGGAQYITNAYTYDAMNRVVMTVVSAGGAEVLPAQTNSVTYNELGKQISSTDAAGRTTTNVYDFNGNQIETDYPDGTVSRTAYDSFGRQQYVQDRAVLDGSGTTTAPANYSVYDASGRVIQSVRCDAVQLQKVAASSGDFAGMPVEQQYKLTVLGSGTGLTTNYTFYDAVGNVQYTVDGRGLINQNQYDAANRKTNVLVWTSDTYANNGSAPTPTGSSQSTGYSYDANGNQLTVTDANGTTTTSHYDAANRVIQMDYPNAQGCIVSRYTYYDGLGRKLQENDEAGVATAYTYDFRGLLTSVTLAFGTTQSMTTVYGYDELGNEISQSDAAGHTTQFHYDALGRRTGRTLPGGQSEGFAYDFAGNQIYATNFNGAIITNQYDFASGRLTNCSAIGYKTTYNYSQTGLRTNMIDESGVTAYFYNSLSQLTNKTVTWTGQSPISLIYRYDALGSLTNLWSSTANGVSNAYQMDLLGRITNVLANGSAAAGYRFDAVGNLQSMNYANGVTNLYQYDSMNRLTNLVWKAGNTALGNFAYTLGATGNRIASADTVNGTSRTYNWAYDYLYRMTGETFGGASYTSPQSITYGFDAVGNRTNRTSSVSGIGNQSFVFNPNDWQTNTDNYDSNGNTTISSGNTYQYDVMNRLTNVNSGQILIAYDGDGNRVKKTVGAVTTYYLVDDRNPSSYAQVLEEYQSSSLIRVYNYGLVLVSQRQVSGDVVSYFGTDGHGSARFLLNGSGGITDTYTYDAYGLVVASTGSTPDSYLYSCQQWDSDLGMYYQHARYYKPDDGRFSTMDSFEGTSSAPASLHKYLYAECDPVNMDDPSGNAVYFVARPLAMSGGSFVYGTDGDPTIGHGYLLFTPNSDLGQGDPFKTGQPVLDTFSFHPDPWLSSKDLAQQALFNTDQKPGRVWELHPDDTKPFADDYDPVLVTADKSEQDKIATYIRNWIKTSPVGYDKGVPKADPNNPNNTIGSVRHVNPPNSAIYYSFTEQNCVWWATIMLKQSGIQVDSAVYQYIQNYNLGKGAASAVISGKRSASEENTTTVIPELEFAIPGYEQFDTF